MDFSVTRLNGSLVSPSEPVPSSGLLELSVIDRVPVLRCNARTLHVFRHGPEAAKVIRKALSKALVPYYPLAGRLKVSSENQVQIACTGEGIWFVEASVNCTLESVKFFDDTTLIPYEKLLPDPPQETHDPLVQIQVTQFECKGFILGLVFSHSVCDGLGAAQFLKAVGELAKGIDPLSVKPVWCRDFIQRPPHPQSLIPADMPPVPNYQLEHANVDISLDKIKDLKQKFRELTGKNCSSFEIVAASVWGNRARAINLNDNDDDDAEMTLVFFANCRHLLNPPLPVGFYGNCFFPASIQISNQILKNASNAEIVKMIQEAKTGVASEFGKWIKGELMKDPFAPPVLYTTLFISEWGRLGFNEVDYGWGAPVQVVPIQGSSLIPIAIVGSVPRTRRGVRLMTWCVDKAHLRPFLKQFHQS